MVIMIELGRRERDRDSKKTGGDSMAIGVGHPEGQALARTALENRIRFLEKKKQPTAEAGT